MDQLQQCPVCTLYLHSGMSMEEHLDTHPKDQVIRALCSMSSRGFGSRCTTPARSERSFCSRSQTPVSTFDGRSTPKTYLDKERRKRPQHTPAPRGDTPISLYRSDPMYDVSSQNTMSSSSVGFMNKAETYARSGPSSDFSHYTYMPEAPEEIEVKYSRSDEYMSQARMDLFTYNLAQATPRFRSASRVRTQQSEVFSKPPNNIAIVKTNMAPGQYVNHNAKPVQIMVPATQGFMSSHQNNMMSRGNEMVQPLNGASKPSGASNPTTPAFTPPAVMTHNSQLFYGEMVHNADGKQFVSTMPAATAREDATSAQSSVYQNVMVVNPYPGGACVYPPQHMLTASTNVTTFQNSITYTTEKKSKTNVRPAEINSTLMIEVSPIRQEPTVNIQIEPSDAEIPPSALTEQEDQERNAEQDTKSKKGLKILSNIKVEVPIKHHKSMLNKVMDLTVDGEIKIAEPYMNANETILPDMEDSKSEPKFEISPCDTDAGIINTFSVIKNIGNPSVCRDPTPKSKSIDSKLDGDQNDSCSIPDLTCKEKASISPCSELSGDCIDGDNSLDSSSSVKEEPQKLEEPVQIFKNSSLLNCLYVRKPKKVIQIKSLKNLNASAEENQGCDVSLASTSTDNSSSAPLETETKDDSSASDLADIAKVTLSPKMRNSNNKTDADCHIETVNLDADIEEQSMDIEPISHSSTYRQPFYHSPETDLESKGCNENKDEEKKEFAQLETMRPVNVIAYGSLSNCDSNREFESVKERFVSMMNDNYFGDNIIGDYFTAERTETFTHREQKVTFGTEKTEMPSLEEEQSGEYMWGESSSVLTNLMHDNYKSGELVPSSALHLEETQYAELRCRSDYDALPDQRVDICADERMPPRGELSGQESNGDMDASWPGMYHNMNSSTSYDLMARETWLSDGSDVDNTDRLDMELEKKLRAEEPKRTYKCSSCSLSFNCPKERRVHRAALHPPHPPHPPTPHPSDPSDNKHKMLSALSIKKEEKQEEEEEGGDEGGDLLDVELAAPPLKTEIKEEPRRKRRDYVCAVCKVEFANELSFHEHLKLHPLECLTCGKFFYRRANLQIHLRTHLAIKNYKCEVCEKRFTTKQKLLEHHNMHTGAAPIKCNLCSATFRRHSNMIQHRNRHHFHIKKKRRDFVCHCGEVFHSRRKLLWHKETHDNKPKACPYCSDKFVHAASLTRHIRRAHNNYYVPDDSTPRENIQCVICKQVYLKNNMEMHLLTHTGKKPYSCVICNKAFSTKWNLKLHRWTHASRSAKPFKCALCKGAFIRHSDYLSHMNSHRSVRPYTCNYCGCRFIRKYNCQRHVKEHETHKKYVCTVPECGKMFHRSYYLTEHMRVHSGARPFACNICGKTSSNKSNHNKHIKIHHAREPVATES